MRLVGLFIMLAWLAGMCHSAAQGTTSFTYQGQLQDGGTNANGAYTMAFALYDAPTGGNQIGNAITNSPTLVNGLFSVNLDFGAGAFDGNPRWLEITVISGSTTETLSPRVQVLPSPYALYAATANTAVNANSASNAATAASLTGGGWSVGVGVYQSISNAFLIYNNGSLLMGLSPSNGVVSAGLSIPRMQAFESSGTFVVPSAEGRIMVEVWGAGGGGGGGGNGQGGYAGGNGGGGGGGGYGKGVIEVTPGSTLTVTVGTGGGGGGSASGGSNGGTSSVADNSGVLISATGGQGGAAGGNSSLNSNGSAGNGGDPGTSTASLFINGVQGGGGPNNGGEAPGGAGANGGAGGAGALVGGFSGSLQNGQTPGGGGASGVGQNGAAGTAGNTGANGLVVIYY